MRKFEDDFRFETLYRRIHSHTKTYPDTAVEKGKARQGPDKAIKGQTPVSSSVLAPFVAMPFAPSSVLVTSNGLQPNSDGLHLVASCY